MSSKWRQYEVLLPLQFNDGRDALPCKGNIRKPRATPWGYDPKNDFTP